MLPSSSGPYLLPWYVRPTVLAVEALWLAIDIALHRAALGSVSVFHYCCRTICQLGSVDIWEKHQSIGLLPLKSPGTPRVQRLKIQRLRPLFAVILRL